MKKQIILILGLWCIVVAGSSTSTQAQTPAWQWSSAISGIGNQYAYGMTTDEEGHLFVTGYFFDTVDLDPGAGEQLVSPVGGSDCYLVKLDPLGNFLWGVSFGGEGNEQGLAVVTDADGSVFLTGLYNGTVDLDPGAGTSLQVSMGNADIFLSKFDADGAFIWARSMGGNGTDRPNAIDLDAVTGELVITGLYGNTADFDPSSEVVELTSNGASDVFVARYDTNGQLLWARSIGGPLIDGANAVTFGAMGEVYVAGQFAGTVDFDPGAGVSSIVSLGSTDAFVLALEMDGSFSWVKRIGGVGQDACNGVAYGPGSTGPVTIVGSFSETVDLDPGLGTSNVTTGGGTDAFVCQLEMGGDFIWGRSFGGSDADEAMSVVLDDAGNVYISGGFNAQADLDPGPDVFSVISLGSGDIFISALDADGELLWGDQVGGTLIDFSRTMAIDATGRLTLAGMFFSPMLTIGSATFDNAGSYDVFLAQMQTSTITGFAEDGGQSGGPILYPNPASGMVTIIPRAFGGTELARLIDMKGAVVMERRVDSGAPVIINVNDLREGMYLLELWSSSRIERAKLSIQH